MCYWQNFPMTKNTVLCYFNASFLADNNVSCEVPSSVEKFCSGVYDTCRGAYPRKSDCIILLENLAFRKTGRHNREFGQKSGENPL